MKRLIPTILILLLACDNKPKTELLTGDLYFSFFRIRNFYSQPDSIINGFTTYFDTLTFETADTLQRKYLAQFKRVKEENLLYHPYVDILTEKDSIVTLYMETSDYNEIKTYKRKELQDERKKITIQADVRKIDEGLFYCVDLRKVDKVDGETLMRQSKFRIKDYD